MVPPVGRQCTPGSAVSPADVVVPVIDEVALVEKALSEMQAEMGQPTRRESKRLPPVQAPVDDEAMQMLVAPTKCDL